MNKIILYCGVLLVFISGVCSTLIRESRVGGVSITEFRTLPKEKQINALRKTGMRYSPLRVRDILLKAYPEEPGDAHELAHIIGETAYTKYGVKGFEWCDSAFTFGCFHGVILAAIKAHGNSESVIKTLADGCQATAKNQNAKNSCAHGIGHGLMWIRSYDMLISYQICDRLYTDEKLLFMCWDGVSMENVVRRGDTAQNLAIYPWKDDDIYFPCDSIPLKYQAACVREQIYLIRLVLFNTDTSRSIDYCMHFLERGTRIQCFGSLGGALYQDDPLNTERIIRECRKVPETYSVDCLSTAAGHQAWSRQKNEAQRLCSAISQEVGKKTCLSAIDSAIDSLYVVQSP